MENNQTRQTQNSLVREYTFNLRHEWLKASRFKRAKRAIKALRELVKRHMKVEEVKISNAVNNFVWNHGARKPPAKIRVIVEKKGNVAYVDLA